LPINALRGWKGAVIKETTLETGPPVARSGVIPDRGDYARLKLAQKVQLGIEVTFWNALDLITKRIYLYHDPYYGNTTKTCKYYIDTTSSATDRTKINIPLLDPQSIPQKHFCSSSKTKMRKK